jgi:hypothetical protein
MDATMKAFIALITLALGACSVSPAMLPRAPRLITPRVSSTGECNSSEIKLTQAQLYSDRNNRWSLIASATNMRVDDYELVQVCITVQSKGNEKQHEETQFAGISVRGYETVPLRLLLNSNLDQIEHVTVAARPVAKVAADVEQLRAARNRRRFVFSLARMEGDVYSPITVAGVLRNNEPQPMVNVRLVIGLYDANDKLIGVADGLAADIAPLAPRSVAPFTATSNMLLAPVARIDVVIEGEPAP